MTEQFQKFEFNYASISLKPYSKDSGTSTKLLKEIIKLINSGDFTAEERVKNRTANQKNSIKRALIIFPGQFKESGLRYFGKIALIKNKLPLIWKGKDLIEEIEKETNREFIEVTNFVVHFSSNSDPIIMFEYNYEGPRLSDIIYYLRQVTKEHKLGKNLNSILHLKTKYDQLDKELSNIFNLRVKVNAVYNNRYNWLKEFKALKDDCGYKDVKLEFQYKRAKDIKGKFEKNIKGISFARSIIEWLKRDSGNIEYLEDLKMSYQINDEDKIIDLDFITNKVISNVNVPLTDGKLYSNSDYKQIIGQELNLYLKTGKTSEM